MNAAPTCPAPASLQEYLLGRVSEETAAAVETHLASCTECGKRLPALRAEDDFTANLRAEAGRLEPADPHLEQLADRMRGLVRSMPAGSDATPADALAMTATPAPALETTQEKSVSLAPPQQPDEIGRLGGYRLLAELGRGGMGVVYKAEDLKLKRLVALKVMAPALAADAAARQRFLREAVAMAAVHHDNIVVIHAVDEDNGVPFLAMEFLHGMPLDKWLKDGRKATPAQVLRIGCEIAEGLAAAHERGLIHRDIKPGNIWLDSDHKGRVKILDFGLARTGTEDVHLTQTGAIVGTPAYMSPEQGRGEKVDGRSDLFSLGCVLYRLCTGAMPFAGGTTMGLLMSLALDHPKPVCELNPHMPLALSDLVMRLLAKKPEDRPQTAREVVQALQAISGAMAGSPSLERRTAEFIPVDEAKPDGINPADRTEAVTAPLSLAPVSGGRKRRLWVIAGVAAGFLATAILIAIVIIIRDKDGKKIGEVKLPLGSTATVVDETKQDDATAAAKPTVDDAWIKQVAAFPADKQVEAVAAKLKELNPGFDGKVTPTVENGVVAGLEFASDEVTNLTPVRALVGLRNLKCGGIWAMNKGRLADLSPLKDMKLTQLECNDTQVSDLSPLENMELTFLRCTFTRVSELSPLNHMKKLTTLLLYGTQVSDLSPLKDMKLTTLDFGETGVSDLSPLKGMPLTHLYCGETQVSDLSPLKGMKLTFLFCGVSSVSDLSPLKDMPLTQMYCHHTQVSDLSPLKDMKLWYLDYSYTQVFDLTPLKRMPLTYLGCAGTRVSDLSPLNGMPLITLSGDFKPERDSEILRSIKTLKTINGKTAADFWKAFETADKPKPGG